ncbi:pyridoxal phosphate-dependent aminotransferase [bacterium]|nr:pyridoxal phosphate-dependent aminotransferase [bacterium]
MKINISNATFSSIVGIGEKVKKAELESGEKYLALNRGVNAVVDINLSEIVKQIDFNSKEFQVYAPTRGFNNLRDSIINEYFQSKKEKLKNISITPGGMPALDLVIQLVDAKRVFFPKLYWGSYSKIATIRGKKYLFYNDLSNFDNLSEDDLVFICDPNNPTGIKMDDHYLFESIKEITKKGATVLFDSPYRKIFYDDDFFDKLSEIDNVIIVESFSKWIGLSGLRVGFIYSNNDIFNSELNIRLLYEFNGISSASQIVVDKIISTKEGKLAHTEFRKETINNIQQNIDFLKRNSLLVENIYENRLPIGIFAVINRDEDFLFRNRIGAVGMDKFCYSDKDIYSKYSRVSVSVKNSIFTEYLGKIL